MLLAGIIRWIVIDRHGFVPPFLDLPNMQSWVDRFTIEYQNLYTRYGALLAGVIGAYLMVFHRERVARFFARTSLVNVLAIASAAIIVPTALLRDVVAALQRDSGGGAEDLLLTSSRPVRGRRDVPGAGGDPLGRASSARACAACSSWRVLFPVAQISYSLYLVHEMFMLWLFPKTARAPRPGARRPRHHGGGER